MPVCKYHVFIFILILNGCTPKFRGIKDPRHYTYNDTVIVDSELKQHRSFAMMDSLPEISFYPADDDDGHEGKRSSMVIFQRGQVATPIQFEKNAAPCHIFWIDSSELDIRIGLSGTDVSAARGIWIPLIKTRYSIRPYYENGGLYVGKGHIDYKCFDEKLVLDKAQYFPGDSLYGFVHYEIKKSLPGVISLFTRGMAFLGEKFVRCRLDNLEFVI